MVTRAALEQAEKSGLKAESDVAKAEQILTDAKKVTAELKTSVNRISEEATEFERSANEAQAISSSSGKLLEQLELDLEKLLEQKQETFAFKQAEASELRSLMDELPELETEEQALVSFAKGAAEARNQLEQKSKTVAVRRTELETQLANRAQRRVELIEKQKEIESRLQHLAGERKVAESRRTSLEEQSNHLVGVANCLMDLNEKVAVWSQALQIEHEAQSTQARSISALLSKNRSMRLEMEAQLVALKEKQNRYEIQITESRVKVESLTQALRRELDTEPEVAMRAGRPEITDGSTVERRVRDIQSELDILGSINPLALQEFEALSERFEFVESQLSDIRSARKELHGLIRSIDEEIMSVFAAAYADVAENFNSLFKTLFPGGKGQLRLTSVDDLLNCGIEIEAKPSGKNVKKLSLLSGGERSLVALAFLFSVFKSRPSPFYFMDEVEAALDEVNLLRFLDLVEEFRKEAQLIIVSHQKRTMEVADVLYGVSMAPGGSSRVVSEKVVERKPVDMDKISLEDSGVEDSSVTLDTVAS